MSWMSRQRWRGCAGAGREASFTSGVEPKPTSRRSRQDVRVAIGDVEAGFREAEVVIGGAKPQSRCIQAILAPHGLRRVGGGRRTNPDLELEPGQNSWVPTTPRDLWRGHAQHPRIPGRDGRRVPAARDNLSTRAVAYMLSKKSAAVKIVMSREEVFAAVDRPRPRS